MEAHIAVLHTKVDALIEKQKELTARVRANEKVVAAVTLLGTVVLAIIGAGYFAPKAEACSPRLDGEPTYCPDFDEVLVRKFEETISDQSFEDNLDPNAFNPKVTLFDTRKDYETAHMGHSFPTDQWIQKMRDYEAQKERTSVEDMLNSSLADYENGSDGSTKSEELLQLQSDGDSKSP